MVITKLIRISSKLKTFLDNNRIYTRETYDDIISRLIKRGRRK